jgi:hypothetical protein
MGPASGVSGLDTARSGAAQVTGRPVGVSRHGPFYGLLKARTLGQSTIACAFERS